MSAYAYMLILAMVLSSKRFGASLFSPVTLHFPPGRNIFVCTGLVAFKNAFFVLKMEFWEPPVFKLKRITVKAYILSKYPLLKYFIFFCVRVGRCCHVFSVESVRLLLWYSLELCDSLLLQEVKWRQFGPVAVLCPPLMRLTSVKYIDISFYSFCQSSACILFSNLLSLLRDSYSKIIMIWLQEDGWVDWFYCLFF